MGFCTNCGKELQLNGAFCSSCGTNLNPSGSVLNRTRCAPGKKLLKITGILFIIFGILGVILGLVTLIFSGLLSDMSRQQSLERATATAMLIFGVLLSIASSGLQLYAGWFGHKNCNKPEKAQNCLIFAIILIIIRFASLFFDDVMIVPAIIGFILPVLYMIGAWQNNVVNKQKK